MHLLVFKPDGLDYDEYELDEFVAKKAADQIRAKFQLRSEHRDGIAKWLQSAVQGDTLLLPEFWSENSLQRDDIAIVLLGSDTPRISRLEVTQTQKIETKTRISKLPLGAKAVTKGKKRKQAKKSKK